MRVLWVLGYVLPLLAGCRSNPPSVRRPAVAPFTDVTSEVGIDFVHHPLNDCTIADAIGPGVCVIDYNKDGQPDLYFVDRAPYSNRLYRNDQGHFTDVTDETGAGSLGSDGIGCLTLDADGDGAMDLLLLNNGSNRLLHNDHGHFKDITAAVGLASTGLSSSATAVDIDGDGDLDVFVGQFLDPSLCNSRTCPVSDACKNVAARASHLYLNQGGSFVEVTNERGLGAVEPTLTSLFFDFNGDGHPDLYVGNDFDQPDRLYLNDGTGHFTDVALAVGLAQPDGGSGGSGGSETNSTMGIDVGDIAMDGTLGIVAANYADNLTRLYQCGGMSCRDVAKDRGLSNTYKALKWTQILADFDNDRDLDLLSIAGNLAPPFDEMPQLYWNNGAGHFTLYEPTKLDAFAVPSNSRGAVTADIDGDGTLDIIVANMSGPPRVIRNDAAPGHSLFVDLDTLAIGAQVTVSVDGRKLTEQLFAGGGYLGSSDHSMHFGLGDATKATVHVVWPGGATATRTDVAAGTRLHLSRPAR
jgi:hypothetical protein